LVAKHSRDAIIPRRAVEIHSLESDAGSTFVCLYSFKLHHFLIFFFLHHSFPSSHSNEVLLGADSFGIHKLGDLYARTLSYLTPSVWLTERQHLQSSH
jgi:hypothetical protein